MYSQLKWTYTDMAEEFGVLVPEWSNLEGYATDAIIRDAVNRGNEFWQFWDNDPKFTENGRITAIRAFVTNYITTVKRLGSYTNLTELTLWDVWGEKLRELEIGS